MKRTDQSKIGFVNSVEMVCSGQRIFRQNEKRVDMGGCGSGGHNKIKGDITEYVRVDSFIAEHRKIARAPSESVRAGVYDAVYFRCPVCSRRVRYLYMQSRLQFVCRDCARVNYPCQQLPRYRWAVVKAIRILQQLDVDTDNFDNVLDLMSFEPEWPAYKMSQRTFFLKSMQLFKYQCMYADCIMVSEQRLIPSKYKTKSHGQQDDNIC